MPAKSKLEDLLGKDSAKQAGMTEESADAIKTGMGLPTDGDNGEGNPLEKMDQISKSTPDKKKSGDKSLNADVLNQMFMTGDNSKGMFSPEVDEEHPDDTGVALHEDQDDKVKADLGKIDVEPRGKYEQQFKNDMIKHPENYKIQTPNGEMTVAEAMRKGYDPLTKTFRKEHDQDELKKKALEPLNDADKAGIEALLDPSAANVAPADAEKYGLKEDSPFIRKPVEEPAPAPAPVTAGGEGAPVGAPTGEPPVESTAPGGMDLSALLGGGK